MAQGWSPELYPSTSHLGKGLGKGHSTKPHNFKSLRVVDTDNPRLEGRGVKRMGNPQPGVRM